MKDAPPTIPGRHTSGLPQVMALTTLAAQQPGLQLLQRSLERGRLAHAYLFTGSELAELEAVARALAKTLNCAQPPRRSAAGHGLDSCEACSSCRRIEADNHPDVHWVRPESKLRLIKIEQMRELMQTIHLKPTEAAFKVAVVVAADRLTESAANAFLKTLEEPPPRSVLILLSTQPQRIPETVLSRCLRINLGGESSHLDDATFVSWLKTFGEMAGAGRGDLLGRYRLLGVLLKKLADLKEQTEKALTARSPLERYEDVEPDLREKWEDELAAAIEAEYRRQRADLLAGLQWWLRDVWLLTLVSSQELLRLPQLAETTQQVARRVSSGDAMENLVVLERTQRLLGSNVQEALALEVGLLKLKL